jgi:hypothetical protein
MHNKGKLPCPSQKPKLMLCVAKNSRLALYVGGEGDTMISTHGLHTSAPGTVCDICIAGKLHYLLCM